MFTFFHIESILRYLPSLSQNGERTTGRKGSRERGQLGEKGTRRDNRWEREVSREKEGNRERGQQGEIYNTTQTV